MFVAEFHDIAKLLDRATLNVELQRLGLGTLRGQSFEGVQWDPDRLPEPTTDTWKVIIRHEADEDWKDLTKIGPDATPEEIEHRRQRFLVTLADHFSSSIAREPRPGDQESTVVKKLWGTEGQDRTIKDFNGLQELLSFLGADPSWDQCVKRYEEALRSIPEDRRAPFTSLYNHLCLTGKIARALEPKITLGKANGQWTANYGEAAARTVEEAHGSKKKGVVGQWRFSLVKLYVRFPHYIVRLQDLNILSERRKALEKLAHTYPDNVLYFTEHFALLFFSEWRPEILAGLEDFHCQFRVIQSDLTTMSSDLDTPGKFDSNIARKHGAKVREGRWPAKALETVSAELCSVCQQKPGTTKWVKGVLEELLCQTCFKRREAAPSAEDYAKWDELGINVAWIKLSVWPDIVRDTVTQLFAQAVNNDPDALAEFRSLPLEMDFLDDYGKVCAEWRKALCGKVSAEQLIEPVSNYGELVILRLDEPQLWLRAVEAFQGALEKYMPRLTQASEQYNPIQLFVDISSTKFPFHEHWRYFSQPRKAINIRNPNKSIQLSLSVVEFQELSSVTESLDYRRPIHELAELWEATSSRAAVLLSAWERRLVFEQKLRALRHNVVDLVQFARLVAS